MDATGASASQDVVLYVAVPAPLGLKGTDAIAPDEGAKVTFQLRFDAREELPGFALIDGDGNEIDVGGALMSTRRGYRLKKFPVPATGRYYVRLDNRATLLTSDYRFKARAKLLRSFRDTVTITDPAEPGTTTFAAAARTRATIQVRVNESAELDGLILISPGGATTNLTLAVKLRGRFRLYSSKNLPLTESGDYTLRVEGAAGSYEIRIRLKPTGGTFSLGG